MKNVIFLRSSIQRSTIICWEYVSQSYLSTGNPVSIVSVFLKAYTKGEVSEVPESCKPFSDKNYDKRKAYVGKPLRSEYTIGCWECFSC